jgi:uncharacterized protein YggE
MIAHRVVAVAVMFAATGMAQETPVPTTIRNEGKATVFATPEFVDFWITKTIEGPSFEELTAGLRRFPVELRAAIDEAGLKPVQIEASSPRIASVGVGSGEASALLRFSISRMQGDEETAKAYGRVCDQLKALAEKVGAKIDGPNLEAAQPETVEQDAVSRATENALYRADAIAALMGARILAVQIAKVIEVKWDRGRENGNVLTGMDRIECAARVEVTYTYGAP